MSSAISGQPRGDAFSTRAAQYFGLRGEAGTPAVNPNALAFNFTPQSGINQRNAAMIGNIGFRGDAAVNSFTGEDIREQATEIQVLQITRAMMRVELTELMNYVVQTESTSGTIIATRMEMPQGALGPLGQQTVPREERMYQQVHRFYGRTFGGLLMSDAEANTHERGRQLFQLRLENLLVRVQVTVAQQVLFSLYSVAKTQQYGADSVFNDRRTQYEALRLEGENGGLGTTDVSHFESVLSMMADRLYEANPGMPAPVVIALQQNVSQMVNYNIFMRTTGNPNVVEASARNYSIPAPPASYVFGDRPVVALRDTAATMHTYAGRTTSSSYSMMRGVKRFGEYAEFPVLSDDVRLADGVTVEAGQGVVYRTEDQMMLLYNDTAGEQQFITISDACKLASIGKESRSLQGLKDRFKNLQDARGNLPDDAFGAHGVAAYYWAKQTGSRPEPVYFLGSMQDSNLPSKKLTQITATVARHAMQGTSAGSNSQVVSSFTTVFDRLRTNPLADESYYFQLARALNAAGDDGAKAGGIIVPRSTITGGGRFVPDPAGGGFIADPNASASAALYPHPPNLASARSMASFSPSHGYSGGVNVAFNQMASLLAKADAGIKMHNSQNGLFLGGDKNFGTAAPYAVSKNGDVSSQLLFNGVPLFYRDGAFDNDDAGFAAAVIGGAGYKLSGERVTPEEALAMVAAGVQSCRPGVVDGGAWQAYQRPAGATDDSAYDAFLKDFGGLYSGVTAHVTEIDPNTLTKPAGGIEIPHLRYGVATKVRPNGFFQDRARRLVTDESNVLLRAIRAMVLFDNLYYDTLCEDACNSNTMLPVRPVIVAPRIMYDTTNVMLMVPESCMVAYSNMHAQFASMASTAREVFTLRATFTTGTINRRGVHLYMAAFLQRHVQGGGFVPIKSAQSFAGQNSEQQESIMAVGVACGRAELTPVAPATGRFDASIGSEEIRRHGTFPGYAEAAARVGIAGMYRSNQGSRGGLPRALYRAYTASYEVGINGNRVLKASKGTSLRRYMVTSRDGINGQNVRAPKGTDAFEHYASFIQNGRFTVARLAL